MIEYSKINCGSQPIELGCAREGYFSCSPLVRVELASVHVPLGSFAIFQQTVGARVLRTMLAVDIVVVGESHIFLLSPLFRLAFHYTNFTFFNTYFINRYHVSSFTSMYQF